ncbi:hypothetical protein GCM10015535_42150 [Streptomyces gelaticus]|uniref:Uncharacterized protein n=1 Tax=Streptomyces gelaticus TaxID=285446 RepID=A0ABQ2W2A5_9ACTN|nr:hypothetical protein GCM10015535_42150 [Streptomyces gelaticus]
MSRWLSVEFLHAWCRSAVAGQLTGLGVSVLNGPGTKATAVTRDAVRLSDGLRSPSKLTIRHAGSGVPDLAARSAPSTGALGRLLMDETLTSTHRRCRGLGGTVGGLPPRMSCRPAVPLGARAVDGGAATWPAPRRKRVGR